MNSLITELVFSNETAFYDISHEDITKIVKATSLATCLQNKNIKQNIKQQNQYNRVLNVFKKFEEDTESIVDLESEEDNKLFNMLLIAEIKELMYESTHDFYFNDHEKTIKYINIMNNRCSEDEINSHLYDPNHFIFKDRKYYFYKIQKRGVKIL
jgi:hypothetical protein